MRNYPIEARRHNATRRNIPLSDGQLQSFIANGFLTLKSSLPDAYHRVIFERFDEVATDIGHFGNNLLPLIPELIEFFDDPVVKGALTSVLGPEYSMHPHRALHKNPPGSDEQQFHKDSYWGYTRRVRNHRPWWVMIMYFPQDTELAKGPTAVMAGSQHLNQRPEGYCAEVPIAGDAGAFVLIHYDVWHRKMKNLTDCHRYMFKFEFARLKPPRRGQPAKAWNAPDDVPGLDLSPAWEATWQWLNGRTPAPAKHQAHVEELGTDDEGIGINAGYRLGADPANVPTLLDALDSNPTPHENERRYSDNGQIWREGRDGAQCRARSCASRRRGGAWAFGCRSERHAAGPQARRVRARRDRRNRPAGTPGCARRRRCACPHCRRGRLSAWPRRVRRRAMRCSWRWRTRRPKCASTRRSLSFVPPRKAPGS